MPLEDHAKTQGVLIRDPERYARIHSKRSVQRVDRWVTVIGIIAPLSTLPQIYQVFSTKSSQDISATTWVLFTVFSLFWLVYGLLHEELPIIITNSLWVVMEATLVAVILAYR